MKGSEELPLVKKYRTLFADREDLVLEYLNSVDNLNQENVKERKEENNNIIIEQGSLDEDNYMRKEIIVMDDSSFVVITLENKKIAAPENDSEFSTLSISHPLGSYYTSTSYEIYNIPQDTVMKLTGQYTLSGSGITFNTHSTAGTSAWFPDNINPKSSNFGNPSSASSPGDSAFIIGSFTYNFLGTNGVAIWSREYSAEIELKYNYMTVQPLPIGPRIYYDIDDSWTY